VGGSESGPRAATVKSIPCSAVDLHGTVCTWHALGLIAAVDRLTGSGRPHQPPVRVDAIVTMHVSLPHSRITDQSGGNTDMAMYVSILHFSGVRLSIRVHTGAAVITYPPGPTDRHCLAEMV
jgi:hypothetical protein